MKISTIDVAQELLEDRDFDCLVGNVDDMDHKLSNGILETLDGDDEVPTLGHLFPELLELARLQQVGQHHHSGNLRLLQLVRQSNID